MVHLRDGVIHQANQRGVNSGLGIIGGSRGERRLLSVKYNADPDAALAVFHLLDAHHGAVFFRVIRAARKPILGHVYFHPDKIVVRWAFDL